MKSSMEGKVIKLRKWMFAAEFKELVTNGGKDGKRLASCPRNWSPPFWISASAPDTTSACLRLRPAPGCDVLCGS